MRNIIQKREKSQQIIKEINNQWDEYKEKIEEVKSIEI